MELDRGQRRYRETNVEWGKMEGINELDEAKNKNQSKNKKGAENGSKVETNLLQLKS